MYFRNRITVFRFQPVDCGVRSTYLTSIMESGANGQPCELQRQCDFQEQRCTNNRSRARAGVTTLFCQLAFVCDYWEATAYFDACWPKAWRNFAASSHNCIKLLRERSFWSPVTIFLDAPCRLVWTHTWIFQPFSEDFWERTVARRQKTISICDNGQLCCIEASTVGYFLRIVIRATQKPWALPAICTLTFNQSCLLLAAAIFMDKKERFPTAVVVSASCFANFQINLTKRHTIKIAKAGALGIWVAITNRYSQPKFACNAATTIPVATTIANGCLNWITSITSHLCAGCWALAYY